MFRGRFTYYQISIPSWGGKNKGGKNNENLRTRAARPRRPVQSFFTLPLFKPFNVRRPPDTSSLKRFSADEHSSATFLYV
jgi:hypothetical protein